MTGVAGIVIVGANLTGGAAATTLRTEGFDGPITLIGAEPHPPYERPPLSKDYLRGETSLEDALLRPAEWYAQNDVELRLGRTATRVDPRARRVHLDDGAAMPYERVLLATGGRNRRLAIPGADLEGVFDLRTFEDADRIREAARGAGRAVIVGAGFIGCEVAASLRRMGVEVSVVEIFEVPLFRVLGREVGEVFEAVHRDHGVDLHLGQVAERFEGNGRLERVVTDRGTTIESDLVVVGIGIEPNTQVVDGSGVEVRNGIVVDEWCRTSVDGVYAAGDVANHRHPLFGTELRVEHWDNALKQGAAAARSMLGRGEPYDEPHWFWSDQYDHNLQLIGHPEGYDELVVRGSLEDRRFTAFYRSGGVVRAVVALDRGRDVRRSAGLIRAGVPVGASLLMDEEQDLKALGASLATKEA